MEKIALEIRTEIIKDLQELEISLKSSKTTLKSLKQNLTKSEDLFVDNKLPYEHEKPDGSVILEKLFNSKKQV